MANSGITSKSKANKQMLENMKYEIANEVGVNLKQGYNGDLSSRDAGRIGGNITRKIIREMETSMSGK